MRKEQLPSPEYSAESVSKMAPVPPTRERRRQDSPERGTRTRHRKRMLSDEAYDRPAQIHQRQRLADLRHRVTKLASITGYLAE